MRWTKFTQEESDSGGQYGKGYREPRTVTQESRPSSPRAMSLTNVPLSHLDRLSLAFLPPHLSLHHSTRSPTFHNTTSLPEQSLRNQQLYPVPAARLARPTSVLLPMSAASAWPLLSRRASRPNTVYVSCTSIRREGVERGRDRNGDRKSVV